MDTDQNHAVELALHLIDHVVAGFHTSEDHRIYSPDYTLPVLIAFALILVSHL